MRKLYLLTLMLITCSILCLSLTKVTSANSNIVTDISWPNCGEKNLQLTSLGIVGVNGGLDFRANPCLASQTLLFHNQYSLYLNTGYQGYSYGLKFANSPENCKLVNLDCLAFNYGYNAALYSIKYAGIQNAHSFVWWLDVETDNSWTTDNYQNIYALIGMIFALKDKTIIPTIGIYSYPAQWKIITDGWKVNLPNWIATGSSSQKTAISYCSKSITGSQVWLSQYTTTLDYNYACSIKNIDSFKIR